MKKQSGLTYDKYRRSHNIQAGPTSKGMDTIADRIKAIRKRLKDDERSDLCETICSGLTDGSVERARKRLREIVEEDYEFPCPA